MKNIFFIFIFIFILTIIFVVGGLIMIKVLYDKLKINKLVQFIDIKGDPARKKLKD